MKGGMTSAAERVPRTESGVTAVVHVADDLVHCQKLLRLLRSCYGPRGKKQSIGGNRGNDDDVDSSSDRDSVRVFTSIAARLTSQLRIKNPFNSLVVGGVKSQIQKHEDGGCLTATLTLNLVEIWRREAADSTKLNTALASATLETILERLVDFSVERLTFRADVGTCRDLATVVKSVLTSNSIFYNADPGKVDFIVGLVLRIFVAGIRGSGGGGGAGDGNDRNGNGDGDVDDIGSGDGKNSVARFSVPRVEYRHAYGLDLEDSSLRDGVFLPAPHDWREVPPSSDGVIVAVFDISLSGDSDEFFLPTSGNQIQADSRFVDVDAFLHQAKRFLDYLIDRFKVASVLCQRVIHPQLRSHLLSRGVNFVQRLSADSTIPVCRISGAKLFSSVNFNDSDDDDDADGSGAGWSANNGADRINDGADALGGRLGLLERIERVRLPDEKEYLHLRGRENSSRSDTSSSATYYNASSSSSSVQTLILCSPTEEHFLEVKSLVRTSLRALKTAVVDSPAFVDGGGCFLATLRSHLLSSADAVADHLRSELRLPTTPLARRGVDVVAEALKRVVAAMTSTEPRLMSVFGKDGHHWVVDTSVTTDRGKVVCECGRKMGFWSVEEEEVEEVGDVTGDANAADASFEGRRRVMDSFQTVTDAMRSAFQLAAILIHTDKIIAAE